MPSPVTSRDVHAWIQEFLKHRLDIGLRNAMTSMVLEPSNPFDTMARRRPKTGFVIGSILFAVLLGCFCYFNFAR